MKVAAIGEAMIELAMTGDDTSHVGVAGDTLNTAIYIKRSAPEISVDYITRLGGDPFSQRIRDFISAEQVGTGQIETDPNGSPGLYAIMTDERGERSFTYWRGQSAARSMFQTDDGPCFDALAGYDLLYLSGITLAILPAATRTALLGWLRQFTGKVAFDGNYRPRLWASSELARATMNALWERADVALPSIDDEIAMRKESHEAIIAQFHALAVTGAVKCGEDGPISLGEPVTQDYPTAPHVVDTTAAGDSFNGGYLAAYLQGKNQRDCLMTGHALASSVIGHRGAIIPT
ncbi:MAG: sugar kinase [Pseudomonadota bacterium]